MKLWMALLEWGGQAACCFSFWRKLIYFVSLFALPAPFGEEVFSPPPHI